MSRQCVFCSRGLLWSHLALIRNLNLMLSCPWTNPEAIRNEKQSQEEGVSEKLKLYQNRLNTGQEKLSPGAANALSLVRARLSKLSNP